MKKTIVFVFAFLASFIGFSQDYAFKILAVKGTTQVKSGSSWQPIKTGLSLQPKDELKIEANSYLALVHKSGSPLQLKEQGTYKVADLASKVGPGNSVVSKYTDFILSSNTADARKNRMAATGSVTRGGEIKIFLPKGKSAVFLNPSVLISWDDSKPGPYVLVVKDLVDTELARYDVEGNSYVLNTQEAIFADAAIISLEVQQKSNPSVNSGPFAIKKLPTADEKRISGLLKEIGNTATSEDLLDKFIMAGFYEKNMLIIDANKNYLEVIKLAPDVPEFKEAYKDFLFRNKLN
jgi:hypothetical protein